MFISVIKGIISVIMAAIFFFPSLVTGRQIAGKMKTAQEDPELVFAVISDVHLTDDQNRANMLALGFYDMEQSERKLDAVIMCGDNTDHGYDEQYELLYDTVSQYDIADEIILAEGNHDTWTTHEKAEVNSYEPAIKNFIKYNEIIAGRTLTRAYYTVELNGYSIIVTGSESHHTDAYISQTQLSWLRAEMDKASQSGKPIFVVSHWPINYTHGLPNVWSLDVDEDDPDEGGMGDQSDEFEEIIKGYDNVYFISGHLHNGFSNELTKAIDALFHYTSVETEGTYHSVNLPSYMYPGTRGSGLNGKGYVFEVYSDKVYVRARSFSAGVWLDSYSYVFDIEK